MDYYKITNESEEHNKMKYKDGLNRFHFLDLDSPDGKHNLSILPEQLIDLSILEVIFNPADYINWTPKWHIARDWGKYS